LIFYLSQHSKISFSSWNIDGITSAEFLTLLVLGLQRSCNKHFRYKSILWSWSSDSNRGLIHFLHTTKDIYVHFRKLEQRFLYSYFIFNCPRYFIHSFIYHQKYLTGFSNLTKPLLSLLLLSKDYYTKALISIVAAVTDTLLIVNTESTDSRYWTVLYLPSTLSRATNAMWNEYGARI